MERIVVYTANIGSYDTLKPLLKKDFNVQYVYITDNPNVTSNFWKVVPANKDIIIDSQRLARYYKTHPHIVLPEHDISIWIDSSFHINVSNFSMFAEQSLEDQDIACYKHISQDHERNCLYEEATICKYEKLDDFNIINTQIAKYRKEGFPECIGLFATGCIVRKNNEVVNKFNEDWWSEICNGSKRDQLSQMYVTWKNQLVINPITVGGNSIYRNPLLIKSKHIHKMKIKRRRGNGISG